MKIRFFNSKSSGIYSNSDIALWESGKRIFIEYQREIHESATTFSADIPKSVDFIICKERMHGHGFNIKRYACFDINGNRVDLPSDATSEMIEFIADAEPHADGQAPDYFDSWKPE